MKQCQKCGMLVNDNSSFCEYCGSNVSATGMESFQVPRSPVSPPRKGSHVKDKSLVAALVVLVVAAVIFASACASTLMNNQPSGSSSSSDSSSSTNNSDTTNGGTTNTDTTSDGTSDTGATDNGDTSASTTSGGSTNTNDGSGSSKSQTDNTYYHKCGYNYYIEYTDGFYDGYSDVLKYQYPDNSNYIFAIVTIKLVNNGDVSISTNPLSWDYRLNGVDYEYSSVSFSKLFNQQTVTVNNGGTGTTEQVYEVPNIKTGATIVCVDPWVSHKPDYAYIDSSISVTVPMTVASPTLYSVDDGTTISALSTDIPISWNNVPNAGYYEVQSSGDSDFSISDTTYGTGTQTSVHAFLIFQNIPGNSGTAYIRVRAYDGWGRSVSDWSNTVSVRLQNY